jgi:PAS domain-containing protein
MRLRQRLENLPVGRKLLAALLVLLAAVMLVANLAFISAAYWITQESMAPQALHTLGRLIASPTLSKEALHSPASAQTLLTRLDEYAPLRAAVIYDSNGDSLAQLQRGEKLQLPQKLSQLPNWRETAFRTNLLVDLPHPSGRPGALLLVASSELPGAFYTGTLTASLVILAFSVLLWMLVARQIKRLVTKPIRRLEELSRQVTREENYALRANRGNQDEIGSLADAFNTMLMRMEAREQQLKRARDDAQQAFDQAQSLAEETRHSNRKLELEVQVRSKIEKKLTGFQNYLNSIIDSMPSALIALDEQLYVTQWNQEASALSGTRLEEALNQPVFLAFPPLKPFLAKLKRTAEQHRVEKIERVTWHKDEEPHHYALTFYPLMGGAGPRRGDSYRRHHPASGPRGNDGAVGEDALRRWPGRRHGARDQQPARRHPAQRAEHPPAPVSRVGKEPRAGRAGRHQPGRHRALHGGPRSAAPARRYPACRPARSQDRQPHAQFQSAQRPPAIAL